MNQPIRFGSYTMDLGERAVRRDGEPLPLAPRVFDTLAALVAREGKVVSKEELMREVWGETIVEESNLTQTIFVLRRALADEDGRTYIETIPRRGYRLAVPVEPISMTVTHRETVRVLTDVAQGLASPARWIAAAVIAVLAVAVTAMVLRSNAPDRLDRMQLQRATTSGNIEAAALSPDARFLAYSAGDTIRLRQLTSGDADVEIVRADATPVGALTFSPDGDHLYYLRGTSLYRVSTLGGNPHKVIDDVRSPVTFSPDGKQLAFVRWFPAEGKQALMIANKDGTAPRELISRARPAVIVYGGPSWSPRGDEIAVVVNETFNGKKPTLIAVNVRDGSERVIASIANPDAAKVAWLPDGSGIVVAAEQLWLYSDPEGRPRRITNDASTYESISVSADGNTLTAVQTTITTELYVAPSDSPDAGKAIFTGNGINNGVSWFRDGRIATLSTSNGNTDVWTMRSDGGEARQLTLTPGLDNHPSVCGDDAIVFASARGGGSTIWRMEADGANARQISGAGAHYGIECSPDGEWLVYHRAGEQQSWRVERMPARGGVPIPLTQQPATFPTISPDGKWIACNSLVGKDAWTIAILSADGSASPRLLNAPGPPTRRLRWSPDGKSITFNDDANLYRVAIDSSAREQLTHFKDARVLAFDWSPDGRSLAVVRKHEVSDAVTIRDFR